MQRTLAALVLLAPIAASAVPTKIAHQGRLFDLTGTPLTGAQDLDFALFDDATVGTQLWSEAMTGVPFTNGYYTVILGSNTPFDPADFDGSELWVEITVNGSTFPDRLPLDSVPYAFMANTAQNVSGGIVDATEIRVNGTTVIDSDGEINGASLPGGDGDTLAELTCNGGEIAAFDGLDWVCAPAVATHTHDASHIDNGVFAIARLPVGGGANDVAAGDHFHSYGFTDIGGVVAVGQLPVGGGSNNVAAGDHIHSYGFTDIGGSATVAQLPVGTGSNNVAAGDHGHSYSFSDIGGSAAFGQLPVGTAANTVAEGDHGHTAADVGAIPSGSHVPVGTSTATCNSSIEGSIRYNATSSELEYCNGTGWGSIVPVGSQANPGDSCLDIQTRSPGAGDGTYWIRPNGTSFQATCDMTTDGGGWTVITDCVARNDLGGAAVAVSGGTVSYNGCLPRSRDGNGSHLHHYDIPFAAGFSEFKLVNWQARAYAASGNTSEFGNAHTNWTSIAGSGDISYGGANQSGPADSFVANGQTGTGTNTVFNWPGSTGPIAIGATDTVFRMMYTEEGGENEGWYPWWSGELHLR